MKPFARVDIFEPDTIVFEAANKKMRTRGDSLEVTKVRAKGLNEFFRAAIKVEMEALKKAFILKALDHRCADFLCPCGDSVAARLKKIDIDDFLDREEKK